MHNKTRKGNDKNMQPVNTAKKIPNNNCINTIIVERPTDRYHPLISEAAKAGKEIGLPIKNDLVNSIESHTPRNALLESIETQTRPIHNDLIKSIATQTM